MCLETWLSILVLHYQDASQTVMLIKLWDGCLTNRGVYTYDE